MPQKGRRKKAKLRSLDGFSLLACRNLGEGGIEGFSEPLSLLPGVRLDVALGDVDPHWHLPPPRPRWRRRPSRRRLEYVPLSSEEPPFPENVSPLIYSGENQFRALKVF